MADDVIALFEFEQDGDDIRIAAEKHYQLAPPDTVTDEDLGRYDSGSRNRTSQAVCYRLAVSKGGHAWTLD